MSGTAACDRQSCGSRFNQSAGSTDRSTQVPRKTPRARSADAGAGGTSTHQRIHRFPSAAPTAFGVSVHPCEMSVSPRTGAPAVRRHHHRGWTQKQQKLVRWPAGYTAGVGQHTGFDFCLNPNPRRVLSRVQDPGWWTTRIRRRHMFHRGSDSGEDLRKVWMTTTSTEFRRAAAAQLCRKRQAIHVRASIDEQLRDPEWSA